MATQTVWNKGKRVWLKDQVRGMTKDLAPNESADLDEVVALRLVTSYPADFALTGKASPTNDELARREQSLRDREANLTKREKALDEREAALNSRENQVNTPDEPAAETPGSEPTKSDLIAEAQALGINADSRWGTKKLAEVIAEKKAAKA